MIRTNDGEYYFGGTGYIAIPADIDRDQYLRDCYLNKRVSILTEDGGFLNRIRIGDIALGMITFPQTAKEKGTEVIYILDEIRNSPVIVDVLNEKAGSLLEGQLKIERVWNNGSVELIFDSLNNAATLVINPHSDQKSSQFNLFVKSLSNEGSVNIEVQGNCQITSDTTSLMQRELVFKSEDEEHTYSQLRDKEHRLFGTKIIVNEGSNPLVKNNELKGLLKGLITELASATVTVQGVPTPLNNSFKISSYLQQLESFASKILLVDQ